MFDNVFGWRKASKCKKLIKRVQCRLKLLRSKRFAIIRHLREDIAQLWKNGYQHIAYNRLDQLCIDEDMMLAYELLHQFSEFIILNLSYIRRHKDLSKDVHEAVSTLIFASLRCGDLPELRLVRKLFEERYGRNITVAALELHPGNLVNIQVRDKLTIQSVSEDVKNRLLDEILKVSLFKPGLLALEYKPDSPVQSSKAIELYEAQGKDSSVNKNWDSTSTSCSIVLQSYPSIAEAPKEAKVHSFALLSTPYSECETGAIEVIKAKETGNAAGSSCSSKSSIDHQYADQDSVFYLDDIQEFKSPTKQRNSMQCLDQDQRFFVFRSSSLYDKDNDKLASKRIRWGSESMEKFYLHEQGCKKLESRCSLHQPCYFYTKSNNNQGKEIQAMDSSQTPLKLDYMGTLLPSKSRALAPYVRAATMPHSREMEITSCTEMSRSNSLPVQINYSSRKHVHPKLPDYDEIAAKFKALKKVHQLNKSTRPLKMPAPLISLILLFTYLSFHISLVS